MREETTIGMSFELDKELNETAALLLLECFRLLLWYLFLFCCWSIRGFSEMKRNECIDWIMMIMIMVKR